MPLDILVVDANERVCKVTKEYLEKFLDCEVTYCLDGYQALKLIDEQGPHVDVFILDVMMRTHGGAVAKRIKLAVQYRDSLLIFYTAFNTGQLEKKFLQGSYIIKKGEGSLDKIVDTICKERGVQKQTSEAGGETAQI